MNIKLNDINLQQRECKAGCSLSGMIGWSTVFTKIFSKRHSPKSFSQSVLGESLESGQSVPFQRYV